MIRMQIQIKEEQANWLRAKGGGVEGFHFPVGEGGDRPFSKTGIPGHRAQPPVSCSRIIPVTRSLSFLRMAPKGYWYKLSLASCIIVSLALGGGSRRCSWGFGSKLRAPVEHVVTQNPG